MEDSSIKIGDRLLTKVPGRNTVEVVVVEIREPNSVVNWTCADQSKRVYKVKEAGILGKVKGWSKYWVRQAHQLSLISCEEAYVLIDDAKRYWPEDGKMLAYSIRNARRFDTLADAASKLKEIHERNPKGPRMWSVLPVEVETLSAWGHENQKA